MTTALWFCAGAFAYLGVGVTFSVLMSGINEAMRKRRFPADAIGPTIALWPATLLVAATVAVAKTAAMGWRLFRASSGDAARIAEAALKAAAEERARILAWIAEEKRIAADLRQAEPRLVDWDGAFDHVARGIAAGDHRRTLASEARCKAVE